VVDASVVVEWLCDAGARDRARGLIDDDATLWAPAHLDAEVLQALRSLAAAGVLGDAAADQAVADLTRLPIARVPLDLGLLATAWNLRDNVTAYDALYVALARALQCELITADRRLAGAPGLGVPVTVV
jgi:predicted nucleic acid-binding protein